MKTTIYKTLLHSAIFLTGVAAMQAQASVAYGVKGGAQAVAREYSDQVTDTHRFYDPQGLNEMYWDGLSVKAGTTASASLAGRQAASLGRAWGFDGSVGLALSTAIQYTDGSLFAKSNAYADSIMKLSSSISGAAGSSGQMVLTGETYYSFSSGGIYGSGGYTVGWLAQSFAPGSGGCFVLGAACRASKQVGTNISPGRSGGGLVPWRLELTVNAGDEFSFEFFASARAQDGAGLTIDDASPTPLQPLTIQGSSAPAMAQNTASGSTRIWLSPGLSLADTSGLVQNLDGSYGFASPVPEPETWAMLLAGLGVVSFAKRRSSRASVRQA
jgi:hypothetical protein